VTYVLLSVFFGLPVGSWEGRGGEGRGGERRGGTLEQNKCKSEVILEQALDKRRQWDILLPACHPLLLPTSQSSSAVFLTCLD